MNLIGRAVVVKVASSQSGTLIGTVYQQEDGGLWIQPSSPVAIDYFPRPMQHPLVFVPFGQMGWLATEMTPQELTKH